MLLRSLLRATTAASSLKQPHWQLSACRGMAAKAPKPPNPTKGKKPHPKFDPNQKKTEEMQAINTESSAKEETEFRRRQLAEDDNNPALDAGPNGRPLFTSAHSLSSLTKDDANTYFKFSMEELRKVLPEGLPLGMVKEFEESSRSALLVRQSFIELRDNFQLAANLSPVVNSKAPKVRKQIVLDGLLSCGKSIALAMLVYWARKEGWLVFYVPRGRDWTHGGLFYKNPHTGEGAGVGWPKGSDKMELSEGTTLFQLIQAGLNNTYAAVGVLVRLRMELAKVTSVPVLFAIDQYNSWFTFTDFEEPVTVRSCRPIHARELTTVNAFRSMMHEAMMVGAFSHSTAVGKLRQELPDVPADARIHFPRYSFDEANTVCHYYLRQRLVRRDAFTEENWKKIFYLSNGNGTEMRYLVPFMR
ncbi:28S ribosomal protein s29 mitochondrial [Phtheirospermum japonicum]|uniref:Small ribosomal subunit protein mS29 n=1 Tax=Phtheirospermum japonicum TaxID=374723 RepID=A0A830CZA9_9LAMI|nr:28S ribosomal protein s29 mitochondrial [Phtheirospermum japonicum]